MSKPKFGILVGHYGPGTGTSSNGRDEWTYAYVDAGFLHRELCHRNVCDPIVIAIDQRQPMWSSVNQEIGERGGLKDRNQELRAHWAIAAGCVWAIELHYNSEPTGKARGFETFYDNDSFSADEAVNLAAVIVRCLAAEFPDRPNRGAKPGRYQILEICRKASLPAVIVEPAFLWEDAVGASDWRERYVRALANAISEVVV